MNSDLFNFTKNRAKAEEAKRLNQRDPMPRTQVNRDNVLSMWDSRWSKIEAEKHQHGMIAATTIISNESHSCKLPLEMLNSIKLCEMEVPKVHTRQYLICKVIEKPISTTYVNILIEDLNGDVEEVALYSFCYKFDDLEWVNPGTILIIKEPYFLYDAENKSPLIRIESPSDVIFVDPADEELLDKYSAKKWYEPASKNADVWRQKGNEYFNNKKYQKALFLYDRGLRCNPDLAVLYLNKSMACIRTGSFYAAYQSAKMALEKGGDRQKALYRMGQAAYGMREWQKSANHFLEVLKEFPDSDDASDQLKRATARLAEYKHGKFDFKAMLAASRNGSKVQLDVADYTGDIEIVNIEGKGRGIIASQDIQRGTLLVVSKAFGSGYSQDFPGIVLTINLIHNNMGTTSQMLQVIQTIQNLKNNPQRGKEIYNLFSGDTVETDEIPFGVIDAARIQQICSLNPFTSIETEGNITSEILESDSHLFIFPSYFNHSCLANAHRTFYGDVMVIHAITDIKKGDEICLSYCSPLIEYSERKKKLNKWKFTCQCKLCEEDANDPHCLKRNKLAEEFMEYHKSNKRNPDGVIAKGEPILKKIREMYVEGRNLKLNLIQILTKMAEAHSNLVCENWEEVFDSIKYLEEALKLMNDEIKLVFNFPQYACSLSDYYNGIGSRAKGGEYRKKAFEYSLCADYEHFMMLYSFEC